MDAVLAAAARFPKPEGKTFRYGTAGFRTAGADLHSTMFRMGVLAALRSVSNSSAAVGAMVTASHNAAPDNGIKLCEPDGGMLAKEWEGYATLLANADDLGAALTTVLDVVPPGANKGLVVVGRDTRESSPELAAALKAGAEAAGAKVKDVGVVTTPMLHWLVRHYPKSTGDYFATLAKAYTDVTAGTAAKFGGALVIDGANGVGAPNLAKIGEALGAPWSFQFAGDGALNHECGAEYVQKGRRPPAELSLEGGKRYCSVDGDCDRVVFYQQRADGSFGLLDGDKIGSLFAVFFREQLAEAGIEGLKVAVVQTAYANGASSTYLSKTLGMEVAVTPTGVKHLHHKATEFDIGIYFEANGHGTVLFSDKAINAFDGAADSQAVSRLRAAVRLINQATGDAISDILMVEAVLAIKGWSFDHWDGLYKDYPSRQSAVKVKDRTLCKPRWDETRLVEPSGLQDDIDGAVKAFKGGRAFVRPSGTEDVVRIYAEAQQDADADSLEQKVADAIGRHL